MLINAQKLLNSHGFPCLYAPDRDTPELGFPARAAYITRKTFADESFVLRSEFQEGQRARPLSVDVNAGDVLIAFDDPKADKPTLAFRTLSFNGGEEANAYVETSDREAYFSLTGPETLELRERLARSDGTSEADRRCLDGLNAMYWLARVNDGRQFSEAVVAAASHASMADSLLGDAPLPVEPDEYLRYCRASILRAQIGRLDPDHADATQSAAPLAAILDSHRITPVTLGPGGTVRGRMDPSNDLLRAAAANETLTRDVFGRLTSTNVSDLSAAIVPIEELQQLRSSPEVHALSGDWVGEASAATRAAIGDSLPGYEFRMDIYSIGGRDMMLIEDSIGERTGHAYVYSWPRATRRAIADMNGQHVLQLSSQECPDAAELARLEAVASQLETASRPAEPHTNSGLAEIDRRFEERRERERRVRAEMRMALRDVLLSLDVTNVEATYEGCAGKGNVTEIACMPSGKVPVAFMYLTGENMLADLIWNTAQGQHPDFDNGHGGAGQFSWDLAADKIDLEHGIPEWSYVTSNDLDRDLVDTTAMDTEAVAKNRDLILEAAGIDPEMLNDLRDDTPTRSAQAAEITSSPSP